MANIQNLLNDEIRRLARKELNATVKDLKAQLVELRKTVGEMNRRIKELEKKTASAAPTVAEKSAELIAVQEDKNYRMTAQRIRKWREKLGVSQQQYAALLSVNALTVCNWENGKTSPRDEQKCRIAALRSMKKRDLKKLFAEKNIKFKEKADKKTAKKAAKKTESAPAPAAE